VQIYKSLTRQTIIPRIYLWDNKPNIHTSSLDVDIYVKSSNNLMCLPRWHLAKLAITKYVAIMDDDIIPVKIDTLERLVNLMEEMEDISAVGPTGVILDPKLSYRKCRHISLKDQSTHDRRVDIIKGRFFLTKKDYLNGFTPITPDCEDIEASAHVSKYGRLLIPKWTPSEFMNLKSGLESLDSRPEHYAHREKQRRRVFSF
jgi:hypothetical protein